MNVKAEVSTTLTIFQHASSYLFSAETLLAVKQRADREVDRYFPKLWPYITKIEAEIVRTGDGVGYKIIVHVTAPLEVMQAFHTAAGVHVEIPREQITYRPDMEMK